MIFKGILGNPAPEPISATVEIVFNGKKKESDKQS